MSDSWLNEFAPRLQELETRNLLRRRRVVVPENDAYLQVDGVSLLSFCSNDYLGLANDPILRDAVHAAVEVYGVGAGASPMVSGFSEANRALEIELARAVGLPRALYFYAGYATNASVIPALVGADDDLFSDSLNHACLIDGARLSKARIHRYEHANLAALEALLGASTARRKLVVSDAVFSMDGDLADIPALLALCQQFDALLMLDDAHGLGVLGPQGRGALAAVNLVDDQASDRILYMSTLGKALGVAGAFVAGNDTLIEWLLQTTRSYTYATAAPALLAQALRASLTCVLGPEGDRRREHLQSLIRQLRSGLSHGAHPALDACGWTLMPSTTAIQPLVIGSSTQALLLTQKLRERGFWVPAIRPPTVPQGTDRLRITLSAAHQSSDVQRLLNALYELAEEQLSATPR